jgi:hypothetical protein
MKYVLLFLLLTQVSFAQYDQFEWFCKDTYLADLKKEPKQVVLRRTAIIAGSAIVAMAIPLAAPALGASFVLGFGTFGAVLGTGAVHLVGDRYKYYPKEQSFHVIELSFLTEDEYKQIYYKNYIKDKEKKWNYNLAPAKITMVQLYKMYPYEKLKVYTSMHLALERINKKRKRRGLALYSYEELAQEINSKVKTQDFCPMNKKGERKALKFGKFEKLFLD